MCVTRRQVMAGAAAVLVAAQGVPATASTGGTHGVRLRWLGVAGWEIAFDGRRVLIDPFLTRLPVFDDKGAVDETTKLTVRTDLLNRHLNDPAELILVTHGHWDHMMDVPHLAKKFGSRVIGTETHRHILTRQGVPADKIIEASGGEYLDFHGFTVQVVRSLHSQFGSYGYFAPGTLNAPPREPETIADLIEGGTLGYLVTIGERYSILFLSGTANFVEREVVGMRPDALVLGMSGHKNVYDYTARVLRATKPKLMIPAHHCDLVTQLDDPKLPEKGDAKAAQELVDTAERIGLRARTHDPAMLRWFEL